MEFHLVITRDSNGEKQILNGLNLQLDLSLSTEQLGCMGLIQSLNRHPIIRKTYVSRKNRLQKQGMFLVCCSFTFPRLSETFNFPRTLGPLTSLCYKKYFFDYMLSKMPQKCLKKFRDLNSTLRGVSVLYCPKLRSYKEMSRTEFRFMF